MTRLITVLLVTHDIRPFTLEENKAFKNLMEIAEPAFYVPSRPTFSQKGGPAVYHDTCQQIKKKLQNADSGPYH